MILGVGHLDVFVDVVFELCGHVEVVGARLFELVELLLEGLGVTGGGAGDSGCILGVGPLYEIFSDMEHSYIIELKYLKSQASEAEVQAATEQAKAQVCRYADTVKVNEHIATTKLHKVYVVYRGVEMVACEEVILLVS